MLTIRLTRKGKKNQPFFRVVVIDKRKSSTGGRAVEDLGYVDPLKKRRSLKKERIQYWLSKGAKASSTIHNLLVTEKIIDAKKINVFRLSKKAKEAAKTAAVSTTAATAEEKPVEATTPEIKPIETTTELPSAPEEKLVEAPKEEVKPVEETKPAETATEEPKA
jgi:small subunit ribosomal protein S16